MPSAPTVVVGAGPAGLAAAAMLRRAGVEVLVAERGDRLGASWRRHYRCLRLHTVRSLSSLPGAALPRSYGRWVAGTDFLDYLERYAASERLEVMTSTEVRRVDVDGDRFVLATGSEPIAASAVVIATGYNHQPVVPEWAAGGLGERLVHSSSYRDAGPYAGKSVLVVGAGNSGSDIALDLARGGAREVWLSVRSAPGLVPRQALGLPAQVAAIPLARAPRRLADAIAGIERRLFLGDLSAQGLGPQGEGVFTRHARRGVLPILDHGFARAVRSGAIPVVPAVEAIDGDEVVLSGGRRLRPDAIVAATGYRPALVPLVGHLGVLRPDGLPVHHGGAVHPAVPGLHFTGFRNPITGALRELRCEAAAIARSAVV
jgi:cation diffusion facilitator CzcD-associated flavoprotein CzcO